MVRIHPGAFLSTRNLSHRGRDAFHHTFAGQQVSECYATQLQIQIRLRLDVQIHELTSTPWIQECLEGIGMGRFGFRRSHLLECFIHSPQVDQCDTHVELEMSVHEPLLFSTAIVDQRSFVPSAVRYDSTEVHEGDRVRRVAIH